MHAESGHVVVLITLLLSTGAGSLLLYQASRIASSQPIDRALIARASLVDARTALLAYSANYADLYGPTGAGPGHLPCPDTDAANDPRLDGPNPPCGRGRTASGALPRHVKLRRHRHAFHAEPDQRILYAVSTGYVNNPLNRFVNARGALETFLSERSRSIAVISMPVSQGFVSNNDVRLISAVVTIDQLMEVVRPAVIRWFVHRASQRLARACFSEAPCSWPPEIHGAALLEWLSEPGSGFIETVPASRHWFVRNGWIDDFILKVDAECRITPPMPSTGSLPSCEFVPTVIGPTLPMIITFKRTL